METLFFSKHLEKGETILFAIHRHWILLLKPGLGVGFLGFFIPWTLYGIGFNTPIFLAIAIAWSSVAYLFFMLRLFEWHANAILITSAGLIKVDWKGFFNNIASRVTYEDVEGAAYEIKGFWPTVLRFGNFTIHLMSGKHFSLQDTARPGTCETKLMELQEKYLNHKNQHDVRGLKSLLSDLAVHHLRQKE